ncbi:MAG: glycosyltransferase family 87 protein [Ktedonobacterales bacterium]
MRHKLQLTLSWRSPGAHVSAHSSSPRLRAMLRIILILLMMSAVAYWVVGVFSAVITHSANSDFLSYYTAALALRDDPHSNIFDLQVLRNAAVAHQSPPPSLLYLYPPLLAVILIPLTLLPYQTAFVAWTALSSAMWLGGTLVLMRWAIALLRGTSTNTASGEPTKDIRDITLFASAMTLFQSFAFFPLLDGLFSGQVTALIFCLIVLALALFVRRPELTGSFLAVAMWIKLYPMLVIGYYALARKYRVIVGAGITAMLLLAAIVPLIGWQGVRSIGMLFGNGVIAGSNPANLSLLHLPVLLAFILGQRPGAAATFLGYALGAVIAVLFAACVLRTQSWSPHKAHTHCDVPRQHLLGVSWALCTMVLLAPVTWVHTYGWLLPSYVICSCITLRSLLSGPHSAVQSNTPYRRRVAAALTGNLALLILLALAYAALALPAYLSVHGMFSPRLMQLNYLLLLFHPLGGLLLWIVNAVLFLRLPRSTPSNRKRGADVESVQAGGPTALEAYPSTRLLILALTVFFAAVCVVDALYWGMFLFISTQ